MRILVAHNAYQQRGGEDVVFEAECAMLEKAGHRVHRLLVLNDHILGFKAKVQTALSVTRNADSVKKMTDALTFFQPDVVHIHNFFPTLSPAVIELSAQRGIPVVLTLHNYRSLCAGGMLLRKGKPCEQCVAGSRWPGMIHRCYRDSFIGSAFVGSLGPFLKRLLVKYPKFITLVALTDFAKSRYIAGGFPQENLIVRGNTIPDPGEGPFPREKKILYVGRLSAEKGVETLLLATKGQETAIDIIGDGPDGARLASMAHKGVRFLGALSSDDVIARIKRATALVLPSRWYEGFPMVVLEAMAAGTPLIASRIGSLAEIIEHRKSGLLIDPLDISAWEEAISFLLREDKMAAEIGRGARARFLSRHSEQVGLDELVSIYTKALEKAGSCAQCS